MCCPNTDRLPGQQNLSPYLHTKGRAPIFVLTKDKGSVIHVDGNARVMPGDRPEIAFELGKPVGLEQGVRFAIREGGKTVGAGLVTAVDA